MVIKPAVIIGLGNIGTRFDGTRHNIGFDVVDALAADISCRREKNFIYFRRKGHVFVKPLTYMNLSGAAVVEALQKFGAKKTELLVICDDFNIPLGRIRFRPEGSSGGHNGLQSIIDAIGHDFARLRLGIGPVPAFTDASDFVLEKFSSAEEDSKSESVSLSVSIIDGLINSGFPGATTWKV